MNLNHEGKPVAFFCQRDLPGNTRAQRDFTRALHGLSCIAADIEHDLNQLFLIGVNVRQAGVVIATDGDALRVLGQ